MKKRKYATGGTVNNVDWLVADYGYLNSETVIPYKPNTEIKLVKDVEIKVIMTFPTDKILPIKNTIQCLMNIDC
jgi:hypothetical protein